MTGRTRHFVESNLRLVESLFAGVTVTESPTSGCSSGVFPPIFQLLKISELLSVFRKSSHALDSHVVSPLGDVGGIGLISATVAVVNSDRKIA